jgi:hypothetical protein
MLMETAMASSAREAVWLALTVVLAVASMIMMLSKRKSASLA